MEKDSKFTRDDEGYVAVRVVTETEALPAADPNSMFGRDTNGNIAVRVINGAGSGGDQHNLGHFATPEALEEAYPTAEAGDFATVESTDSIWLWDTDDSEWKDSGAKPTSTFLPYPAGWTTNSTTKAFCDDIAADTSATVAKAYLGEVTISDLPAGIVNAEIEVKIMDGTSAANKVIVLELTSGNVTPYKWMYVYWNGGTNTSGWKTWQEPLVSGTNIKTINGESLLGSGNLSVGGIPQYSTMPVASASNVGQIVQYSGTTDATYTNGYFYKCVESSGVYSWKQTDVQPAGSGGGIEWAAHIDKPANAQTGTWNTNSVWEITGGLPDGLYEYYFKVLIDNNYNTPATVVYKVMFKLYTDNGTQYANGNMSYVIDGDWQPYDLSEYLPQQQSWDDVFWKDGSDLIIFNSNPPFYSKIYASSDAVAKVFEITAITNVNTGDKYIPTGHIYNLDEQQSWDGYIGGLMVYDLVKIPEQTTYNYGAGWTIGQDKDCYILLGQNTTGTVGHKYGRHVSEVDFTATSSLGGKFHVIIENSQNSYKAKILEATGDFVNSRLLTNYESGALLFDANFPTGDSRNISANIGFKGASKGKPADLQLVESYYLANFTTEIPFETVGAKILPENLGVVAQYNEEIPNVAYTNGYFYQATGTVVTVSDSITCEEESQLGETITCTNVAGFISALATEFGYSTDDIKYWLRQPNSTISYEEGQSAYWNIPGFQIPENIITTYFSFSPALQSGAYIVWEMTFTPEHQEVQNPAWVRFNTQPATTGTTGTLVVANWSSSTQTITVNGVTASNNILVSPAPASAADWASAGILCTAQGTNSLTFTCTQTPSNDITVNVAILN